MTKMSMTGLSILVGRLQMKSVVESFLGNYLFRLFFSILSAPVGHSLTAARSERFGGGVSLMIGYPQSSSRIVLGRRCAQIPLPVHAIRLMVSVPPVAVVVLSLGGWFIRPTALPSSESNYIGSTRVEAWFDGGGR